MIQQLRDNLKREKEIAEEISKIDSKLDELKELEGGSKEFYESAVKALKTQVKTLNDSIPNLLDDIRPAKPLKKAIPLVPSPAEERSKKIVTLSYVSPVTKEKKIVTIKKEDKEKFAKELKVSEESLENLKRKEKEGEKEARDVVIKKQSNIAKISNKFFLKISEKLSPNFKGLGEDLKKSNMQFMTTTYLSIALFFSSITFILSLVTMLILLIININLLIWMWLPFLACGICFVGFYIYPSTEKSSFNRKISDELPFATIYMAAISGSNIEPSRIFKIIATTKDYPAVSTEIKKLLTQIDVYGYDLVTALKNIAKQTPNKELSELLGGIATNIVSGGSLKEYLQKKSDNLLLDYKYERQKSNALAETFMDIYISLLITAPMILVMLVVILNVTDISIGLPFNVVMILAIFAVAIVNIIFMVVLQLKQPKT